MYYSHFGLRQPPFKITPNTEFFFSGGNRGAVLDALIYAITSGEGIVKVVGEVGSGKTMLCRMLQTLLPHNVESIYLANPSVAPEDVLHAIAFELRLQLPENADRLQVMHALQNHLLARHSENRRVVIFIEEAQGMPLATLEEIRLLSNLETSHDKLLQIVLFGQPELDVNLNEPHIRQLRERITHSFNLGPLAREEIGDYLIFRLRTAGYFGPQLFSKRALHKIATASKGLVRRVNILADKSMLAAFADNTYAVLPKHVNAAIRDSEFGTDKTKSTGNRRLAWLAALLLLLTVLLAALTAYRWMPAATPHAAKSSGNISAQQKPPAASPPPANAGGWEPPHDIFDERLKITEAWLARQANSAVTIELISTPLANQLRQPLQSLSAMLELDNLYVCRCQAQDGVVYTLLYGSFADRDAASRALQALPGGVQSYRPRLRTVAGLRNGIKQVQ